MIESNRKLCICGECPTYTECSRQARELLFCALGRSPMCITEEVDCICPTCPVTEQLGLINQFFCLRGTEREQRQRRV
ncbi:MAG: DUF2769 domain-containing protein [Candidatus Bathyarchaeia archaeon]